MTKRSANKSDARAVLIYQTYLDLVALMRAHLKPKKGGGHATTQLLVLMAIWESGPVSASDIARRCHIPRTTCLRVANTLVRRRIASKDRDSLYAADDRHLAKLEATPFFRDSRKLISNAAKRL
jgi:hypothetical protein